MIIDMHTHIFPDKIAEKTIPYLMEKGHIQAYGSGTLADLKEAMHRSGTDISVVMPVCTAPRQFDSINRFAGEVNGKDGIISFGAIHPDCENIREKLIFLKEQGFVGIKLHPDYQDTYIGDESCYELIRAAVGLDLYVTIHAGLDVAYPDDIHCKPKETRKLLDRIYPDKDVEPRIILAHLGGLDMYGDVEKYIVGQPVYLDLAVILGMTDKRTVERIIHTHGADKILYASDYPWSELTENVELFMALDLTDEERELILCKNAKKILRNSLLKCN